MRKHDNALLYELIRKKNEGLRIENDLLLMEIAGVHLKFYQNYESIIISIKSSKTSLKIILKKIFRP